jgi:membrane-associated phospholipid phosphatase
MVQIIKRLFKQRPADTLNILFLLSLVLLILVFYPSLPKPIYLITIYSILIVIQVVLIKIRDKGNILRFFYDLIFPTFCILIIFDSLEWIVHSINPEDIDPLLIRLDYMIFGNHPTVVLEKITTPFLTDLFQIAYSTYYLIPISFGIVLLMGNKREQFNRSLFMIYLCFYLSYVGYILFPALGPRFTLDHLQTVQLKGLFVAESIQQFLNILEGIKRDAFPSGHTAVALTVLYLSFRYQRKLFWIYLPIVSALVFSTVYCRYHYVVDVFAGFLLTLITIVFGEWYYRWWLKRQS